MILRGEKGMNYKKTNQGMTGELSTAAPKVITGAGVSEVIEGKGIELAIVIAAVILAVQIIWQNVVSATDMVYKGIYAFDIRMVILSAAMIFFSVKYIMEQFILPIYVFKKCNDTSLYCRKIHCDNLEELVRYIILEQCPYIKGVYVSEDGCIHVKGRHTLHSIIIDESGAEIISEGYDCKTKIEINAIAKFLSAYKEK